MTSESHEDVLYAFAVEPSHDRATVERYLREYPELASDLLRLSQDLAPQSENDSSLSASDRASIETAWSLHVAAAPQPDPFANWSVEDFRRASQDLGVPRQVVIAFQQRRVRPESVPGKFLSRFAAVVRRSTEEFIQSLSPQFAPALASSHKADSKPYAEGQITFEQLLIEARVSEDDRRNLLLDD